MSGWQALKAVTMDPDIPNQPFPLFNRLALVLLMLFAGWHVLFPHHYDDLEFDSRLWIDQHDNHGRDNPRGRMFDDLRHRLLLERPNRQQVVALLGPPEYQSDDRRIGYKLGMWSGFGVDHDVAYIGLDDQDKVSEVFRLQH